MNIDVRGVHYSISDHTREFIDKKIHRLDFAKDLIVDLLFTIKKERRNYKIEVTINFRWGYSTHISVGSFEVFEGIDILFDKLEVKVRREKDKKQSHQEK